jgi:DHA2 family multidrug resistance protein
MGYDAIWAGITVSALGIGPIFLSLLTPLVIHRLGNVRTLLIAFTIFALACFYNAYFTTAVTSQDVAFSRFLFGLAFVFYVNPLIGMSVEHIPIEQLPNATGIFHFIRSLVGAIGTAIFKTLWERRTIYHHQTLGENLTLFNPFTPPIQTPADLIHLNQMVDQQAALLALNDCFYLMGWCFFGLVLFLLFWYFWTRGEKKEFQDHEINAMME